MNREHFEAEMNKELTQQTSIVSEPIPNNLNENLEERTSTTKVFSLGENRFQAVIYPEPVHYLDAETGEWQDIDNTLIRVTTEEEKPYLTNNKNGDLKLMLRSADASNMVTLQDARGRQIAWRIEGAGENLPMPAKTLVADETDDPFRAPLIAIESEATYADILPGVNLRCMLQGMRFKDELIFGTQEHVQPVTFMVSAPDLVPYQEEDGTVEFIAATGETVFTLPAPFMKDCKEGHILGSVQVTLTPNSEQRDVWKMVYTPDMEWVSQAQFPIILDPVVVTYKHSSAIEDNYVTSAQPNSVQPYTGTGMKVTYNSGNWGTSRAFIRFIDASLPVLDSSHYINKAVFSVMTASAPTSPASVYLKEVLGPWSSSTITFNNAPALNQHALDYAYIEAGNRRYEYDISNLVRKWYAGTNYGFALEANSGTYMELYTSDHAYNKPYILISYVSLAGLEDYLAYESQSAGLAGTGHVSLYNGNLIFEHQDFAENGNLMPVSSSHFYNSCYRNIDAFGAGLGWKSSLHQCVHRETITDNTGGVLYYVYTDGDGTRHYFKQVAGIWQDQSGLNLTLSFENNMLVIRDKGDNVMKFQVPTVDWGGNYANVQMLWLMTDANGNAVTINHDANRRIINVEDGAGRNIGFSNDGRLQTIFTPGYGESGYCGFEYDAIGRLTKIWHLDGEPGIKETIYTYNAYGLLETVTNHDGLKLTYEYYLTREPFRVKKVTVSNGSVIGNSRLYEYQDNLTIVTDLTVPNGKKLYFHFNDNGNVISVNDQLGYAAFAKYPGTQPINRPETVSKMQRVVCNLLKNHSFETGDYWGLSSSMSYATDSRYLGNRALKATTQGVTGMHTATQSVQVERGKTYTFSFYTRKSGDIDVWAYFAYLNAASQWQYVHAPSMKPQLTENFSRMQFTFTVPADAASSYITVAICAGAANGVYASAWFDCAQLEEGVVANRYNMLENGDFSYNSGAHPMAWQKNSSNTSQDIVNPTYEGVKPAGLSGNTMRIYGTGRTKYAGIYQDLTVSGVQGDVFVAGGWSMNHSMPRKGEDHRYNIRIAFRQAGGSSLVDTPSIEWSEEWSDWQFAAGPVIAPCNYSAVRFNVDYERNINYTEFDGFFLHKEEFGSSFQYDSKGNITSTKDLAGLRDYAAYDAFNNMTSYRQPGKPANVQTTLEYGATDAEKKRHLLRKSTSPLGTVQEFGYNENGDPTSTVTKSNATAAFMQSTQAYTANNNYPASTTDARGKTSQTGYNPVLGTLEYAQDPTGQRVNYLYDQIKRVTRVYAAAGGKTYMNEYAYTGDYLTQVKHNTSSDTASDVIYYFSYDALGNPTTVKVGTQTLSTNVYTATGDKLLQRVEYGNGGKVHYSRDGFKRVTGVRFDAETADRYQYDFDATGQTARVRDNHLNRTTTYEYDSANRPMKTTQTDGNNWNLHTSVLSYDQSNNLSRFEEQVGYWRTKYGTDFLYDNENRPISLRYNGTVNRVDYSYDALGRLLSRNSVLNNTAYLISYSYLPGGFGANSTTPLIGSITQPGHNLSYTYDDRGNIASVAYNGQTISYVYDGLGQLIRVNDGVVNETYTFEYDRGGNILNKKHYYPCATGTLGTPDRVEEYLYEDANWKDRLTARVINGNRYPVVSDAIGNITLYAGWTYNWQAGRQLASQTNAGGTVEYKYNADGLRVQKKKGDIVTDYVLSGKNIVHMTVTNGPTMHFYYDAQDRPAQVVYNGVAYRYVHNLQGDIIAIVDAVGNTVVQYTYGAWGEKKSVTGSMATTLGKHNPFRYRGYVWDEETWMYYLRSRYYYPELQRFISADTYMGSSILLEHNTYTYCMNSPLMFDDPSGNQYEVNTNPLEKMVGQFGDVMKRVLNKDYRKDRMKVSHFLSLLDQMRTEKWSYSHDTAYGAVDCVGIYRFIMYWYYSKRSTNALKVYSNVEGTYRYGVYNTTIERKSVVGKGKIANNTTLVAGMALFRNPLGDDGHVAFYVGDSFDGYANAVIESVEGGVVIRELSESERINGRFTHFGYLKGLDYTP